MPDQQYVGKSSFLSFQNCRGNAILNQEFLVIKPHLANRIKSTTNLYFKQLGYSSPKLFSHYTIEKETLTRLCFTAKQTTGIFYFCSLTQVIPSQHSSWGQVVYDGHHYQLSSPISAISLAIRISQILRWHRCSVDQRSL